MSPVCPDEVLSCSGVRTCREGPPWAAPPGSRWYMVPSVAGAESGSRHSREHLLLVVDGAAFVGGHIRRVMRRDHERIDVLRRDREAEVVADEPAAPRARIPGAGTGVLGEPAEMLARLLLVPCELRDADVSPNRSRSADAVLVGLQRGVDAEVRPADVGGENARVAGARLAAVVEGHRDGAVRAGRDRRLELVGGNARRVDVVVDYDWRRPMLAAVYRLRELHVRLANEWIPVLIGEVEMAGIGRARREVLDDAAAETRVRVHLARRDVHRRDRNERAERPAVVGRAGDVDRRARSVRRARDDGDIEVPCRVDLRVDEGGPGADLGGRCDRDGLGEGLAAVTGARDPYLDPAAVAVEDRPGRVDVVLEWIADDVVDGDPLLVLDVAKLLGRGVVRRLQRHAAVPLHPVASHVVAVRDVDL